jgi:hypothetical protein
MSLRRNLSIIIILSCVALACAPKNIPPELKPAYTANEVLLRVQELQNTVISLYDSTPRGISKVSADLIVRFTVSTATILQNSPAGWKETVQASWSALKSQYTPTDVSLQIVWNMTDVLITSLKDIQ